MLENERYSAPAIGLHWIMFVLIAGGWALGSYVSGLQFSPQKLRFVSWHKWTGVTIFALAVMRLAWRLGHPAPVLPPMPEWQRRTAIVGHVLLYVLIVVIPITGWLFSSAAGVPTVYLGLLQLPDLLQKDKATADLLRFAHMSLNWTLLVLVIGHAFFALKHHWVSRDSVLTRMLPFIRPRARKDSR